MSSYRCWILSKKGAEMTSAGVGVGQSSMQVLITGMIILRTPPPFPNTSLSLPTDLVLAFDPDWRSTPRGCTVSARYHVNSHTKATLCHFRFSRLQNPGVSTLVCGRGRFLVVALPPPPSPPPSFSPRGAPAAAVDRHTSGSRMSPLTPADQSHASAHNT